MIHRVHAWNSIRERYDRGALLLGNGASIAVDQRFSYSSLKEKAQELDAITPTLNNVFKYFKTDDFELILRMLWHARHVNSALDVGENQTTQAYQDVRNSLIQSVRAIHVQPADVGGKISNAATFMANFAHVISLNYDLTTYWAVMAGNEANSEHCFKDCFIHSEFDDDWRKFSAPIGNQTSCTTVFYPHGNLALCRDNIEQERKIQAANGMPLLETVLSRWESGDFIPLFVSEGITEQKQRAIGSSTYLQVVLRSVLPSLDMPLVIYGWGIGEHDTHILRQIGKSDISHVAVSVFEDDQTYCDLVVDRIREHFHAVPDIVFFDAQSDDCWVNETKVGNQEESL